MSQAQRHRPSVIFSFRTPAPAGRASTRHENANFPAFLCSANSENRSFARRNLTAKSAKSTEIRGREIAQFPWHPSIFTFVFFEPQTLKISAARVDFWLRPSPFASFVSFSSNPLFWLRRSRAAFSVVKKLESNRKDRTGIPQLSAPSAPPPNNIITF